MAFDAEPVPVQSKNTEKVWLGKVHLESLLGFLLMGSHDVQRLCGTFNVF